VPGIDPQLAAAIVAQRDAYGAFQRLSELKSAVGIDERLFRELRRYLSVE
jgi:DNA uptake protein ComE-like DNA-binding protein